MKIDVSPLTSIIGLCVSMKGLCSIAPAVEPIVPKLFTSSSLDVSKTLEGGIFSPRRELGSMAASRGECALLPPPVWPHAARNRRARATV